MISICSWSGRLIFGEPLVYNKPMHMLYFERTHGNIHHYFTWLLPWTASMKKQHIQDTEQFWEIVMVRGH